MKVSVKTAKSDINRFHFSYAHGTTSKFFQTGVADIMEIRKGSRANIRIAALRRIDPMVLPPMSAVRFSTKLFYVPMVDVCPYYNELDARTPYSFRHGQATSQFSSAIPTYVPKLETKNIKILLFNNLQTSVVLSSNVAVQYWLVERNNYIELCGTTENPPTYYDIKIKVVNNTNQSEPTYSGYAYFRYTARGRVAFKMLKQLGYDFAVTADDYFKTTYQANSAQNDVFSAMPLLAFVKVYLNYYESAQYINNTTRLARLNSLLHIDYNSYSLDQTDLDLIFDLGMYVTYDLDYYTSSWVNPANGNNFNVNNEQITLNDNSLPTGGANSITTAAIGNDNIGTPHLANLTSNGYVTDNALNLLKRLTNYVRRHQIAGGRMVDRLLVEYGVSVDNSYSRRSSFIDAISSVMNVTPVMNTTTQNLGEYAGFGSAANDQRNNMISVNIPEQDGFVIVVDTAIPEIFYSQGYKRQNRHLTKWDFVAGTDFDAVGVQAIEQGEILMSKEGINYHNDENPTNLSFGFVPRGAEYKQRYNTLTGDFIVDSVNTDIEAFFTDRKFLVSDYRDTNNKVNITTGHEFVSTYGSGQFAKIFYTNKEQTDYIKSVFRFDVELFAPYQDIYEEYKLEDSFGTHEVKMDVGGQQMN